MTGLQNIKKYFTYEDRLRTNVSIITGILIVIFNLFSGYIIVYIIAYLILGMHNPGQGFKFLFLIPGIAAGAGLLKLCILILDLLLGGTDMEEYSYLRVILLASIAVYLTVLFFFILIVLSAFIESLINSVKL